MMKCIFFILTILLAGCDGEQSSDTENIIGEEVTNGGHIPEANCEKCVASPFAGPEPDTAFYFSNGQKLLLCGYAEKQSGKKIYSEFILSECGNDSIVDFWSAVEEYEVDFLQDTLRLSKLELLALGKNRELIKEKWLTEYLYYNGENLQREKKLNPEVYYNQNQIKQTLKEYESTKRFTQITPPYETYAEDMLALANRLMVAAISGSGKAEKYFKEFETWFKPDGAYAEWYEEMAELLTSSKKSRSN